MSRHLVGPDPHGETRTLASGVPLDRAHSALIAIHGRGASAEDILGLAKEIGPAGVAIVAPEAADNTWYPYRFTEPFERNEPYLSSALKRIASLLKEMNESGIPADHIAVVGFSQGACLALESIARNPRRYAAAIGFSGGLIGPPGTRFDYPGSLQGTPVFLGCSDIDAHIPVSRVEETAEALGRLGASVDARIYPGMGHTINRDEIDATRALLARALTPES